MVGSPPHLAADVPTATATSPTIDSAPESTPAQTLPPRDGSNHRPLARAAESGDGRRYVLVSTLAVRFSGVWQERGAYLLAGGDPPDSTESDRRG